jgi:hypothetical protein
MRSTIGGKDHVEVARKERGRPVVEPDHVAPVRGLEQLAPEGPERAADEGTVPGDERADQSLGIGTTGKLLKGGKAPGAIEQDARGQHVVPDAGGVSQRRLVAVQHAN